MCCSCPSPSGKTVGDPESSVSDRLSSKLDIGCLIFYKIPDRTFTRSDIVSEVPERASLGPSMESSLLREFYSESAKWSQAVWSVSISINWPITRL